MFPSLVTIVFAKHSLKSNFFLLNGVGIKRTKLKLQGEGAVWRGLKEYFF